jgi:hypothetical protein
MPMEIAAAKSATLELGIGQLEEFVIEQRRPHLVAKAGDMRSDARGGSLCRAPCTGM